MFLFWTFIIIVTFLYITNSYFIGCFFKKANLISNSQICTIFGTLILFIFVYLACYIFYFFSCTVFVYVIFFACTQIILIIFYGSYWQYLFIKNDFYWKKVLTFFLTWLLILLTCFGCTYLKIEQWNTQNVQMMKMFEDIKPSFDNTISFSNTNSTNVLDNFDPFNFLNAFWINCWKIVDFKDKKIFCLWTCNIIVSFLFALLCSGLIDYDYSWLKIMYQVLLTLFVSIFSLINYGNFAQINTIFPFLILTYFLVLFNTNNKNIKAMLLFFNLIAFVAVDVNATFFLIILLWIITIFYFIKRGISPLANGVSLLMPLFLALGSWLNSINQLIYIVFCFITLVMPLIIYKTNQTKNLSLVYSKFNNWILKHNHFITYLAAITISSTIVITNIFIFNDAYHWKMPNEAYELFFAFHISKLGKYDVSFFYLLGINIFLCVIYVTTTICYFVLRKKNQNIYNEECFPIFIITFITFCNPLSAHLFNFIFNSSVLTNVNYIPLMAIVVFLYKTIYNTNRHVNPWKYDWY